MNSIIDKHKHLHDEILKDKEELVKKRNDLEKQLKEIDVDIDRINYLLRAFDKDFDQFAEFSNVAYASPKKETKFSCAKEIEEFLNNGPQREKEIVNQIAETAVQRNTVKQTLKRWHKTGKVRKTNGKIELVQE